ncbi:MAG: hypothetical protein NC120_07915 [Ruminococcus sp.]|nr:hypothetical protein [Ruminococcus sp.]
MRVLFAFGEPFGSGGQEAFAMNVLQTIYKTDLIIDFYTPYYCDNEKYKSIIERNGGMIYAAGLEFKPVSSRLNIINPLVKLIRKNKYDVVHINLGSISCLAYSAFAASICHVKKIIVHSHSTGAKITFKHMIAKIITMPLMLICPTDYFVCSEAAGKYKFSNMTIL